MGKVTVTDADKNNINSQKRRSQNRDEWKSNVAKIRRNSGEAYASKRGNGPMVEAKQCPPGGKRCGMKCHFDGCDLSQAQKKHIFDSFYATGVYEVQRTYLLGLISCNHTSVRMSHKYYLNINGARQEVCRFTFLDVHQITKHIVETVVQKIHEGAIFVKDGRGLHDNHRQKTQEEVDLIRNHILSYEFQPVHYSRKEGGHDECLPPHLNVSFMFREFKNANPDYDNIEKKEWLYRQIFKDTGILPYQPKSDTCRTCDRLHIQGLLAENDQEKEANANMIHEHLCKGENGYKSLYSDINRSRIEDDLFVLCVDLQKVLFTPTLTHSDMFYSRQLSTYNLCVYDGRDDIGNMILWNETEGKRGVNEMASSIYHYIRRKFQVLGQGGSRRLILWSDRCRGQFNNYHIICVLMALIRDGYFTEIEQKFLLSGHSFMPCDRLFALIEKRKKGCYAYIPDHWERIIREAQPTRPFVIRKLATAEIFDIKSLEALVPRPDTLKVTELARVWLCKDSPSLILSRNSHCDEVWQPHFLLAPRQGRARIRNELSFLNVNFAPLPCYGGAIPLSEEKKRNFRAFLDFLPPEHRAYYEMLLLI